MKSLIVLLLVALSSASHGAAPAMGRNMMDYYLPMPIYDRLESTGIWGAPGVIPREIHNGLEDSTCKKWSYWDGTILKGKDNKYHLYGSRWDQSAGHDGWGGSIAIHAVSDSITGPYIDKGPLYTWSEGKGHNVTAIVLPDGRYAVLVSETVPASIFIASDPNGPFEYQGHLQINTNGHNVSAYKIESNMSICIREDGSFIIVTRDGIVMHSTSGILGPYLIKTDKIWPATLSGYNTGTWEDPVIWRSGKKYYCTVNSWASKKAIYMTSNDGISNWTIGGEAYAPGRTDAFRYTDGTKNQWTKLERPGVYVENGVLKYLTFAGIDVEKDQDKGNDNHNSKIIVVPFNGYAFDDSTSVGAADSDGDRKKPLTLTIKYSEITDGKILTVSTGIAGNTGPLDIKIYSVNGKLVAEMRKMSPNGGSVSFDEKSIGSRLSPGAYVIAVRCGTLTLVERCTIQ